MSAWRAVAFTCLLALLPVAALAQTAPLDLTSEPKGVLPPKTQQKLWDAYKTAGTCFNHPNYDPGTPQSVPVLPANAFMATPWQSPFATNTGAHECGVLAPSLRAPDPVPVIKLDETYGARVASVDAATAWFVNTASYVRLTNDPVARGLLRQAVVDWAKGKSLGKGIHVSWGNKPVDYQMLAMILAVLSGTAAIAPDFTADERVIVGPWLNDLVKQAAASHWKDREDNKAYMRTYAALLWGLIVGDNRPVQDAINSYKLAIHDMRPDGSWPIDSQREQRGLHYDSAATSHLVTIATALQNARGVDLFSYTVDGRSVHTAVDFVVASIQNPGPMNAKYAISCPDGGHLNNDGIDHPDLAQYDEAGYLLAYAERFPDRDSSKYLLAHYSSQKTMWSEKNGGAPQCYFALNGGDITRAALVLPPPTPKANLIVHPHEEISNSDSGNDINSLIQGNIEGAPQGEDFLDFNITGTYSPANHSFGQLHVLLNKPLTTDETSKVKRCAGDIVSWGDGTQHLQVDFNGDLKSFTPVGLQCLASALTPPNAYTLAVATGSFADIAIGFVVDGTVARIKNSNLREFISRVASGEVTIAAATN